jgi:hypothetical protein
MLGNSSELLTQQMCTQEHKISLYCVLYSMNFMIYSTYNDKIDWENVKDFSMFVGGMGSH